MKTEEDEAFDDLAKRQGAWGGGFQAKRKMAADKLHWSDCAVHNAPAYPAGKCDCGVAQEPVTTVTSETGNPDVTMSWWHEPPLPVGTPLYTYPPKREWVGLTDDDICELYGKDLKYRDGDYMRYGKSIEAKLKEKNNGA